MSAFQKGQVFKDLRWGIMPTPMLIGGSIAEARARGTCAVAVADPARLAAQVADPEVLIGFVRSSAGAAISDVLGERSAQAADKAQFTTVDPAVLQAFRGRLETRLAEAGLQLTAVTVEAIECL